MSGLYCSNCLRDVNPDSIYCQYCGAKILKRCPECHLLADPEDIKNGICRQRIAEIEERMGIWFDTHTGWMEKIFSLIPVWFRQLIFLGLPVLITSILVRREFFSNLCASLNLGTGMGSVGLLLILLLNVSIFFEGIVSRRLKRKLLQVEKSFEEHFPEDIEYLERLNDSPRT